MRGLFGGESSEVTDTYRSGLRWTQVDRGRLVGGLKEVGERMVEGGLTFSPLISGEGIAKEHTNFARLLVSICADVDVTVINNISISTTKMCARARARVCSRVLVTFLPPPRAVCWRLARARASFYQTPTGFFCRGNSPR